MIEPMNGGPTNAETRTADDDDGFLGIVMADARLSLDDRREPRITAFIWGGKVRPAPILPYGRWKGAA